MKIKKILLTGSTGMVGKNILDINKNYFFLHPDRKELNLLNFEKVYKYINKNKPDLIIHAAGVVGGIKFNIDFPIKTLVDNTTIAKNVILAAYQNSVQKLLNLSSSCIYPPSAKSPLSEDDILTGKFEKTNEGYAFSKVFSMLLCNYISLESNKYKYKNIIPCNLYGKHELFNEEKSHLISAAILKIYKAKKKKRKYVEIWGDGTAKREFLYVEDFVDFIFYSIKKFDSIPNNINVGYGKDFSIKKYYSYISKIIGWDGKFFFNKDKPQGQKRKLVSIKKQLKIGWRPKHSLQDGIKKTVDYFYKINNL
jgi:GDP-L-fucose synthase